MIYYASHGKTIFMKGCKKWRIHSRRKGIYLFCYGRISPWCHSISPPKHLPFDETLFSNWMAWDHLRILEINCWRTSKLMDMPFFSPPWASWKTWSSHWSMTPSNPYHISVGAVVPALLMEWMMPSSVIWWAQWRRTHSKGTTPSPETVPIPTNTLVGSEGNPIRRTFPPRGVNLVTLCLWSIISFIPQYGIPPTLKYPTLAKNSPGYILSVNNRAPLVSPAEGGVRWIALSMTRQRTLSCASVPSPTDVNSFGLPFSSAFCVLYIIKAWVRLIMILKNDRFLDGFGLLATF